MAAPPPNKWQTYYDSGTALPWDSGSVSSQLACYLSTCMTLRPYPASSSAAEIVAEQALSQGNIMCPLDPTQPTSAQLQQQQQQQLHICNQCAAWKPPPRSAVLEIGCGTGGSAIWLAQQGFDVTGIDLIDGAIAKANAAAEAAEAATATEASAGDDGHPGAAAAGARRPTFLVHDVMQLPLLRQRFAMIYDCQTYHALVKDKDLPGAQQALPQLLYNQLLPGGLVLMLTGNANEPEVGPSVLNGEELVAPLLAAGFRVLLLQQTRFDATEYYCNVLGVRPLAWWIVLQRPQ